MINKDDKRFIQAHFRGDKTALEILISRHLKSVYNFVYQYTGNKNDAEDITQETFVKVWRKLKKFDTKKSFKTWVFVIAKNTALDFLKKKKAIPFSLLEGDEEENTFLATIADTKPLPDEAIKQFDTAQLLEQALKKLPAKYRVILALYYIDQLNFREIAETLNEPINTVKSKHRRAKIMLKKILPKSLMHQNKDQNRINNKGINL